MGNDDMFLCCFEGKTVTVCVRLKKPEEGESHLKKAEAGDTNLKKPEKGEAALKKVEEADAHVKEAKESTPDLTPLRYSIRTATEAFKDVGARRVPYWEDMNIYVDRSHRKVYLICESGCTKTKCVCGWTTVKAHEILCLENKVHMKAWYFRLLYWLHVYNGFKSREIEK